MVDLLFYTFSFAMLLSGLFVITARNPVHAVLFLILAFFNCAGIFVLIGAEFIAMTLIIVYVGAVAVLFLFVVMMMNINLATLRQGFLKYLPLGILLGALLFGEIYLALMESADQMPIRSNITSVVDSNTVALGKVLYTDYFLPFQLAGIILLIAMIGAIILTLTHSTKVRRQDIYKQVARTREESIRIVNVNPGQGVHDL
jgi:NADH-quinone oxidoreductase subunit J